MNPNFSQVKKEWKEVVTGEENRKGLFSGIQQLAIPVGSTMGARGRTVNIHSAQYGVTTPTKDGVTVADAIELEDDLENIGANMVKEVARKVVDAAGDGTTTTIVITAALIQASMKLISEGNQPFDVVQELTVIEESLKELLNDERKYIETEEDLFNIANIASNSDKEIADIIVKAIKETTDNTVINLEKGISYSSYVDHTDGYGFDRGYLAPDFLLADKLKVDFQNPLIFLTADELIGKYDVEAAMTVAQEQGRPLVIICKDLLQEAYNYVMMNRLRMAFPVVAIKAPRFGIEQANALDDIAVYTGAKVFGRKDGYALSNVDIDDLGSCDSILVASDSTNIFGGHGDPNDIDGRIAGLESKLEDIRSREKGEHFEHDVKERISKLEGGICTIYVGGTTEVEIDEKYDRYEDALLATMSALKAGYISGGGSLYLTACQNIRNSNSNVLRDTLAVALLTPTKQILENGFKLEALPDRLLYKGIEHGVNVVDGNLVNNYEEGIIDSAMIADTIIETVFPFVKTFITSDSTIIHKLEYFDKV